MKDTNHDRDAILAVIEAETDAYLRRDYDSWEKCWHDGPETRRIHTHVGTGVTVVEGAEIKSQMYQLFNAKSEWQVPTTIERENLNVVMSPDMAWISYDQIGDMASIPKEMSGHYHELKILHKVDGSWKIACIVGTQLHLDHVRAPLIEVEKTGRVRWMNTAAHELLPQHPLLRIRGGRLHVIIQSAADDLLDAIDWIAQVRARHTPCVGDDAVARAVALGQDDTGLAHICWAILRDGKLLITFDDTDRLAQQIATAAKVYGLSQTQAKLTRLLVDGCDLSTAAASLDISLNTTKTHLQRIYDKTGVRAQPALVRLLLNAERHGV